MAYNRVVAPVMIGALFVSACGTPPVTPVREEVRRTVVSVSADLSGVKHSDTSDVGARGSEEGASKGALAGANAAARGASSSLLGALIILPFAAAIGSATGASNAKSPEEVDAARAGLRAAIQDTDFSELLRRRLSAAKAVGGVEIASVSSGSGTAGTAAGNASHLLTLEYSLGIKRNGVVVPDVGVYVLVKGQLLSGDRKQVLHTNVWGYCGEQRSFIDMSQNNGAPFRTEMEKAAEVLGEAILFDLFNSNASRSISQAPICMDYSNVLTTFGTSVEPPLSAVSANARPAAGAIPAPPRAEPAVAASVPAATPVTPVATVSANARPVASDIPPPPRVEPAVATSAPPAALPSPAALQWPDGVWRGAYNCQANSFAPSLSLAVDMTVRGGNARIEQDNANNIVLNIRNGVATFTRTSENANGRQLIGTIEAPVNGNSISYTGMEKMLGSLGGSTAASAFFHCTVALTRS